MPRTSTRGVDGSIGTGDGRRVTPRTHTARDPTRGRFHVSVETRKIGCRSADSFEHEIAIRLMGDCGLRVSGVLDAGLNTWARVAGETAVGDSVLVAEGTSEVCGDVGPAVLARRRIRLVAEPDHTATPPDIETGVGADLTLSGYELAKPRPTVMTGHMNNMVDGRGGLRTRDLRIAQVRGSAGPRWGRGRFQGDCRTESLNPMSAALCPAKPPGRSCTYRDDDL